MTCNSPRRTTIVLVHLLQSAFPVTRYKNNVHITFYCKDGVESESIGALVHKEYGNTSLSSGVGSDVHSTVVIGADSFPCQILNEVN